MKFNDSEFEKRDDLRDMFDKIMRLFLEEDVKAVQGIECLSPVIAFLLSHIKDKDKRNKLFNDWIESVNHMIEINEEEFNHE